MNMPQRFPTLGLGAMLMLAATVQAAAPDPDQVVRQALITAEQQGEACRRAALSEVLGQHPDHHLARWQAGFVRHQDAWVPWNASPAPDRERLLTEYRERREAARDGYSGHRNLANWSRHAGLRDLERVHLMAALAHEPDNAGLRRRLGQRELDGLWVSSEEWNQQQAAEQALRRSMRMYERRVVALRKQMLEARPDTPAWKAATETLNTLATPEAVPAIQQLLLRSNESLLGDADQRIGQAVVRAWRGIDDAQVIEALADLAAHSPWHRVRHDAALALAELPIEAYVPLLLRKITPPAELEFNLTTTTSGVPLLWQTTRRDLFDAHEVTQLVTRVHGNKLGAQDPRVIRRAVHWRQLDHDEANAQLEQTNQQIYRALIWATRPESDHPLANIANATPEAWFAWYREQNDEVIESPAVRRRELTEVVNGSEFALLPEEVAEMIRRAEEERLNQLDEAASSRGGSQSKSGSGDMGSIQFSLPAPPPSQPSRTFECFVAGTPVWTETGPMPIEEVAVGDWVLAQDPTTGELAYKPVVRATIRDPKPLVTLQLEQHSLGCTPGHVFWVSGQGWKRARDLEVGMRLHTITGSQQLVAIEDREAEPTYNLEVLDFNTFFAGEDHLLTRDVTSIEAVRGWVPGLKSR